MKDLDYLRLLSKEFSTSRLAAAEIINLRAILALPKGNEYFFSDIHGEYESFRNLVRSASGVVRAKIQQTFNGELTEEEQLCLANLIYSPKNVLSRLKKNGTITDEWYKTTIQQLVDLCRLVSSKYTRSKVRKKLPAEFSYAIEELMNNDEHEVDKKLYYREIINTIIGVGEADGFIIAMSDLIHNMLIDHLHIIGDIFDRGPRADFVMDELMKFNDIDIQWGNHDISWMGAAAGNTACIATVLRIATGYNCFDVLEDGYGINLRQLSMFAAEVYKDDPCECFKPHLLDQNKYDSVDPDLAAKMCKAITIIGLKLEGQLIISHPEYNLDDRLILDKIDFENGTVRIEGKDYPMKDMNFPTIDPESPYELTDKEKELMDSLKYSFRHSERLHKHIKFLYTHGSLYLIYNNNLLFHGCIPMTENGDFASWNTAEGVFSGRELMDYINKKVIDAYYLDEDEHYEEKRDAVDMMWYLWCGPLSPLFGKDKITTFEHIFLDNAELKVENYNPYYKFSKREEYCNRIFKSFGMPLNRAHIINGHVPVKVRKGEKPVKAGGRLYIIDGGLSKAYHNKTGIAGYTLIFNSHHLALAEHRPYVPGGENTPTMHVTEVMDRRLMVNDTDIGAQLKNRITELEELLKCYSLGLIREDQNKI